MQSLHHLLMYVVHDIDHMFRYLLSIYLSSISINSDFLVFLQGGGGAALSIMRRWGVEYVTCWPGFGETIYIYVVHLM